ncbi:MAG: hypothetical protein P4L70_08295 [Parasulfuritortus sp.]|nr:hypothetical protein [Parasulfuritortus sp.]
MPKLPFAEGRSITVSPKRYAPSYSPVTGSAESSSLVSLMVERLRDRKKSPRKTALADWESDGGSVTEPAPATP